MTDNESKNKFFETGTLGSTFARNLLRSLLTTTFETAKILLENAMQHEFISNCFREDCQLLLLDDVDKWIGQLDDEKRNSHVQLLITALQLKKFAIAPRIVEFSMKSALAVGDSAYAETNAIQILKEEEKNTSASLIVASFDILGRVYSDSGDFTNALRCFLSGAEKANKTELWYEEWDGHTNAIWCLYAMDRNIESLREIEKAEGIARRLKRKGMLSKTLLDKGNSMMALGNIQNAKPVFVEALDEAVNDSDLKRQSDALGNLGIIDYYGKRYETAKDFHLRALAISRQINDAESIQCDLNNLASSEFDLGLVDQAIQHKEEALKIARARNDHANVEGYLTSLQEMYRVSGKLQAAEKLEENDDEQDANLMSDEIIEQEDESDSQGKVIEREVRKLLNAKKFPDAKTLVLRRLKQYPGDHSVRELYGVLLSIEGNETEARKQFTEIIREEPGNLEAYFRLFTSYQKSNQISDILIDYKEKLSNEPYNAGVRMIIALASANLGKYDEAIQLATAAANLRQREELPYRVLVEVQWLKAMSQLRENWDGAWSTFNGCLAASSKLLSFQGNNRTQWYTYVAQIFYRFALDSHSLNPPFDGMDTQEIQILALAMEYYKKSEKLDETRNHAREVQNIEATLLALARPGMITLAASYLLEDGHDETALVLLLHSLQIDNFQAKAFQQLSTYFHNKGDTEGALRFLQKAIDLEPQNREYLELKILYENQVRFMNTKKAGNP